MKSRLFMLAALASVSLHGDEATTYCESSYSEDCCCGTPFLSIGGGYSWSFKTSITTGPNWDPSPQGYKDDLNGSEFYFLGLGYHFPCLLSASFELDYHPSFRYKRFQQSTSVETVGFLGDKTRYFKLSNTAFTFNLFLNKNADFWCWTVCDCYKLAPFIGAGVGVAYNTLSDFHSVLPAPSGNVSEPVRSIMVSNRRVGLAGQAMGGITANFNDRFSFDVGYRWFYGGKFRSNNYLIDSNENSTPGKAQPWKGRLMANEVFASLNFSL